MKKLITIAAIACFSLTTFAYPPRSYGPYRPAPHHYHHHGSHHSSEIFWGVAGGLALGSLVANIVNPPTTTVVATPTTVVTPTVVTTPPVVVQPTTIWVPGHYETQVQPNGTAVNIYVAGHYETR